MLDERLAHRPIEYDQSVDEGWLNRCDISALGQEGELSYFRLRDPTTHQAWIAPRSRPPPPVSAWKETTACNWTRSGR